MTVRCPSCATVAPLTEADITAEGRMVQCRQCGTRWLARSFENDPYGGGPLLPVATSRADISDAVVIEHVSPAFSRRSMPPPPIARLSPTRRQNPSVDRRLKALGIIFGVLAALVVFRAPIVSALPELSSIGGLRAEIDALEFQNVRSETVRLGRMSTLFVEGEIVNRSGGDVELPAVRITLRSPAGDSVTSWLVEPSARGLAAGRSIGFRSALASPPSDATQVTLNLAAREGQTIGLR